MGLRTHEQEVRHRTTAGQSLRLLLVQILRDANRPMSIPDLITACEAAGVVFTTRASKLVSDTLRWETRKSRVVRIARGRYRFGRMPRSTGWWLDQKVLVLRQHLAQLCRDEAELARSRPDEVRPLLV